MIRDIVLDADSSDKFAIAPRNRFPVAMDTKLGVETRLSRRLALEDNDATALPPAQQESLNGHKVTTRLENELYLREHPEIRVLLSSFVSEVLLKQPKSIRKFAAEYFTDPSLNDATSEGGAEYKQR